MFLSSADKLPFLLILVPPIPLALALYFAPESPYYLARKDRLEEATAAMDRLHAAHPSVNSRELVEQIAETNRLESEMRTGGTWAACFSGVNRRRTEIAIVAWTSPALVGFAVRGTSSELHNPGHRLRPSYCAWACSSNVGVHSAFMIGHRDSGLTT